MIFALEDIDGNTFNLNDTEISSPARESLTLDQVKFKRDVKLSEKSYLPGAVLLNTPRYESGDLTLRYTRAHNNFDTYRANENELLEWLSKAVYLINVTKEIKTRIECDAHTIKSEEGALFLAGRQTISLKQLNPFWETTADFTDDDEGDNIVFSVTNDGFLPAQMDFTLETEEICDTITIKNNTTGYGIIIQDSSFGNGALTHYYIYNTTGLTYLEDVLRVANVQQGTGFFDLAVGVNEIEITTPVSISAAYTFKKRYFI